MELIADLVMELVPNAVTEFFSETCFRYIRERVKNPVLQKLLCILAVTVLVVFGVLLAVGILLLFGIKFG